jgi:hypothetical protein
MKFTATKKGWTTHITVDRETPDPMTGDMTQGALVEVVRNYTFSIVRTGHNAWSAKAKWEGKTRRGNGPTREAAIANLH